MSIGKLQAALASATNEVTVAAANINFDFALVKCEAPPEYQPLGLQLSAKRKHEAENGSQHVTARRLGALFEGLCPPASRLIAAFGKRASEISNDANAKFKPQFAAKWIFSDYAGVDATSLWAAATSSKAAIPVYLLACMLARVWSDAEATSLWVEIVAERRREIAARFEAGEALPFATTTAAAQQELTRDQLAKWDASARAWLRTADDMWPKQRRQFLLVADNIEIAVNSISQPYHSIIQAWVSAMETMDKLIGGEPHAIKDGSVLLGISSWHIYPDMTVLGTTGLKSVAMIDPLVHPGGVVTLGIKDPAERAGRGVFWSLSLAHHKFYGKPVQKLAELNRDGRRLAFNELQIAVLGIILSRWNVPVSKTDLALQCLLKIASTLPYSPDTKADQWINMLVSTIMEYFQGGDLVAQLVSLGRRRPSFIPPVEHKKAHPPFFGLLQIGTVLKLIPAPDDRVNLLLRLALRAPGLHVRRFAIFFMVRGLPTVKYFEPNPASYGDTPPRQRPRDTQERHPFRVTFPIRPYVAAYGRSYFRTVGGAEYSFHFGDADCAAIFFEDSPEGAPSQPPSVEHEDIIWAIQHDMISPQGLKHLLMGNPLGDVDHVIITLCKLEFASRVYETLSRQGASIAPKALNVRFGHVWYKPKYKTVVDYIHDLHEMGPLLAMEFISFFEIGKILPEFLPHSAGAVIGIAVGDSVYVPTKLLSDPAGDIGRSYKFSRLLGNIGRPGLTVLTCPAPTDLQVRDFDPGSWQKVPPRFNGECEDAFSKTSMHISFTDWQTPLFHIESVGQHDSEINHVEVVVSVRDSGEWVADVNPLWALGHSSVQQLPWKIDQGRTVHDYPQHLHGSGKEHQKAADGNRPGGDTAGSEVPAVSVFDRDGMMAIESWDQILDLPEGVLVIKSSGNWVSRLAIVSVIAHHCKLRATRVYICPDDVCWDCVSRCLPHSIYIY
ncbi:hypothetical protein MAPG_11042 [Magnaporthiopsis poae ATCC 64411]|uniref:Uncharacterized protein n=1 Tax=Magnaporthiopsis poae (strain ATCC 64411 / 73-15) TaxID=644358 RepID=A0A0C4EE77_MAGP6|nr:hypothetical protein MAPG_11042 [Magnaporthiopsis poae ATCC 64411]